MSRLWVLLAEINLYLILFLFFYDCVSFVLKYYFCLSKKNPAGKCKIGRSKGIYNPNLNVKDKRLMPKREEGDRNS